jgi:L-ascorbate metabolism protein UlaG (beta-lactamase superfamily)
MVITFYGEAYIKIQQGEQIIAFNPISKDYNPKALKFGSDIALISCNLPAYNGKENVTFGSKEPFIIDGPGEYEIGGMFIRGFATPGPAGKINTIFTLLLDGIRICHLGALAEPDISSEIVEEIGVVDILFLPIGGGSVIDAKGATKVSSLLEPKIIVPIGYKDMTELSKYLKEEGIDKDNSTDKLTIKKKDLEGKEAEVVVIKSL